MAGCAIPRCLFPEDVNSVGCEVCVARAIASVLFSWRAEASPVKDAFLSQVDEEHTSLVFASTISGQGSEPKTGRTEHVSLSPVPGYREKVVATIHQGVGATQYNFAFSRFGWQEVCRRCETISGYGSDKQSA